MRPTGQISPFEVHIKFLLCSPSALYEQTSSDISDLWHFPGRGRCICTPFESFMDYMCNRQFRGLQAVLKWLYQWFSRLSKLLLRAVLGAFTARGRTAHSARVNGAERESPRICCPACPPECVVQLLCRALGGG